MAPDDILAPDEDLLEDELLELESLLELELLVFGDLVVLMFGDFPEPELVLGDLLTRGEDILLLLVKLGDFPELVTDEDLVDDIEFCLL